MRAGVQAADPAGGDPLEVPVHLGTASGALVISPGNLTFEKGKLYKLVFKNPGDGEHRLAVRSLASSVRTFGKPEIDLGGVQGGLNFKKGRVPFGYLPREIDVAPGGVAEWLFVPYQQTSARIGCIIESHARAGMTMAVEANRPPTRGQAARQLQWAGSRRPTAERVRAFIRAASLSAERMSATQFPRLNPNKRPAWSSPYAE